MPLSPLQRPPQHPRQDFIPTPFLEGSRVPVCRDGDDAPVCTQRWASDWGWLTPRSVSTAFLLTLEQ